MKHDQKSEGAQAYGRGTSSQEEEVTEDLRKLIFHLKLPIFYTYGWSRGDGV